MSTAIFDKYCPHTRMAVCLIYSNHRPRNRKTPKLESFGVFGAAIQIRTGDLILTKDALYLLSYSSISDSFDIIARLSHSVNTFFHFFQIFFLQAKGAADPPWICSTFLSDGGDGVLSVSACILRSRRVHTPTQSLNVQCQSVRARDAKDA